MLDIDSTKKFYAVFQVRAVWELWFLASPVCLKLQATLFLDARTVIFFYFRSLVNSIPLKKDSITNAALLTTLSTYAKR
jgi:hypothetical protein